LPAGDASFARGWCIPPGEVARLRGLPRAVQAAAAGLPWLPLCCVSILPAIFRSRYSCYNPAPVVPAEAPPQGIADFAAAGRLSGRCKGMRSERTVSMNVEILSIGTELLLGEIV